MPDRFAKPVQSEKDVIDYLISEYEVSEVRAAEIVKQTEIEQAIRLGSFIYYVGDKIADSEGLESKELFDDEENAFDRDES